VVVNVVEKYRVFGEYAEVDVEDFIAIVGANVEGYSWTAMAVLSVTKLSVLALYLLHDKLFSACNSIECATAIRPRRCRHRHEHGVKR
jgi:hypothetical protein